MDALLVRLYLNYCEDLLWKLHGDLSHGECHFVDVKDSNFGDLGIFLLTPNYDRYKQPLAVDVITMRLLN